MTTNFCQAPDCSRAATYRMKGFYLCNDHTLSDIRQDEHHQHNNNNGRTTKTEDQRADGQRYEEFRDWVYTLKRQELMQTAGALHPPGQDPIKWTDMSNEAMISHLLANYNSESEAYMSNFKSNGAPITPRQAVFLHTLIKRANKNNLPHDYPDPHENPDHYTKDSASDAISDLKDRLENGGQGRGQSGGGGEQGQGEGQGQGGQGQGQGGQSDNDYVTHPELEEARKKDAKFFDDKLYFRDEDIAALKTQVSDLRQELSEKTKGDGRIAIHIEPRKERKPGDKIEIDGHVCLPLVITALEAGENVMLVGPAGTGKSTLAENAAQALGLDFYSISLGPTTPTSKMFGYLNATGEYVDTPFRRCWEFGGVMLIDEYDNGHPGLNAEMNQAWAGTVCAFPDKMVKMHPDFRLVTTANTFGRGADRQYVGRNPLDAATLDRFITIEVNVDEQLEHAIAHSLKGELTPAQVDAWIKDVRTWRKAAEEARLNVIISPRATFSGVKLMAAGFTREQVIQSKITPGLAEKDLKMLGVR